MTTTGKIALGIGGIAAIIIVVKLCTPKNKKEEVKKPSAPPAETKSTQAPSSGLTLLDWQELRIAAGELAKKKGAPNTLSQLNSPDPKVTERSNQLLAKYKKVVTKAEHDAVLKFLKTYEGSEAATLTKMGPDAALVKSFFSKLFPS